MLLTEVLPYLVRMLGAVYLVLNSGFPFNFGQKLFESRRNTNLFLADRTGKMIVLWIAMLLKTRVTHLIRASWL